MKVELHILMFKKITLLSLLMFCVGKINAQSTLNVRAFVQGYYNTSNGTMIPIIDPVNQPTIFDTIRVELHETTSGNLAYSLPSLFDINGNASILIPSIYFGNNYFIVLRHRNSIETWSALPLLITNGATYDFTTGISQAYGNNMILVDSGTSAIYSGDFNQDGFIDSLDNNQVYDSAIVFPWGYYMICDLNGDSAVDVFDMVFVDNNYWVYHVHIVAPVFTFLPEIGNSENEFHIYPNPSHSSITFSSPLLIENNSLSVYSSSNERVITKQNFRSGEHLETTSLKAGIYFIYISTSNHILTQKFIVDN